MNQTNSTISQALEPADYIIVGSEVFTILYTFMLIVLFFIFRKQKELKYRGILPYITVFAYWTFLVKIFFINFSLFNVANKNSWTFRFSCWWGLIPFTPVLILFMMVQILSIGQYLLKKRLDSLKEVTWGLFDDRHSKSLKIMAEKMNKESSKSDSLTTPRKSLFSKSRSNSSKTVSNSNSDKQLDTMSEDSKSDSSDKQMTKSTSDKVIELRNFDETSGTVDEKNKQYSKSVDFDESEMVYVRSMIKRIKFVKFFTTDIFKFIVLFLVFVFSILLHVIVHGGIEIFTTNACTFEKYIGSVAVSSTVAPLFIFFGWLLTTVFMILDVIFFIKEEGCSIKKFYFEDDPYGFRIEQLVGFVVLAVMVFLVTFQMIGLYAAVFTFGTTQSDLPQGIVIFRSIGLSFIQIFTVTAFSAVGLVLAIISWIKMKFFQKKVYDSEFDAFVSTKSGKDIFKKYAKIEWSLENILFFEEIGKYEKIPSKKHAQRRSKEIVQNYIMTGSPLEVNLSHDVRKNTMKKVDNFDEYKEVYQSIFNDALKETKRNMRDTFTRISVTKDYLIWKETSKVLIDSTVM
eukprot:gene2022-1529_t